MIALAILLAVDVSGEAQLGKTLFQQGKVEEAIPHFQKVVEAREKDATAWYNLAYANRKAGHFAQAPARPDLAALIAKGDAAYAAKEYRNALFAYQDAIIADPRNVPALIKAGHAYARLGHSPEAVDQWSKALQLDPQNAEARAALAEFRDRPGALPTPAAAPPPPITTAPNDEAGA